MFVLRSQLPDAILSRLCRTLGLTVSELPQYLDDLRSATAVADCDAAGDTAAAAPPRAAVFNWDRDFVTIVDLDDGKECNVPHITCNVRYIKMQRVTTRVGL